MPFFVLCKMTWNDMIKIVVRTYESIVSILHGKRNLKWEMSLRRCLFLTRANIGTRFDKHVWDSKETLNCSGDGEDMSYDERSICFIFFYWKQVKLIESYRPGKSSSSIRDSILMTFRPSWVSWSSLTFGKESEDLFDMFCLMTSQKIPPSVVLLFKEQFFHGIIFFLVWGIFQLGKTSEKFVLEFFRKPRYFKKFSAKILVKILCLDEFSIKSFQKSPENNYFWRKMFAGEAL